MGMDDAMVLAANTLIESGNHWISGQGIILGIDNFDFGIRIKGMKYFDTME